MKTILERLGGGGDNGIIHEKENEEDSIKKYNHENSSYKYEDSSEKESLLFNISKQYELNRNKNNIENNDNNSNKNNILGERENKIKVNYIKCTLSFLDKGKAIFVSENDDIFSVPSILLNKDMKVGNAYLLQIEKLNNHMKKLYEIENIQNKYKEWK